MDFMKRASYLFIFSILKCVLVFSKNKVSEHCMYASKIQGEFIQEMEKKYGCVCIGTGGSMPKNIQEISVKFTLERRATIDEARIIEVLAIERFREMLNADEKIRPYLCEYPFPPDRVEVAFFFYAPFGAPFADGNLMHISQIRGKLFYDSEDPITGHSISLFEEPYAKAKKIVEASAIDNPWVHQGKPHEPFIDALFCSYLKEMWDKHCLECERIGGKLTEEVDEVVVRLIYFRPTQIDKARELQVIAAEKILEMINGNEHLRPYIKNYPLSLDRLKVTVIFRKRNYYPFFDGTLDYVQQNGDEVTYVSSEDYVDDQSFSKPPPVIVKESYREAAEKVRNLKYSKKLNIKW